jgi:hypothetical protein
VWRTPSPAEVPDSKTDPHRLPSVTGAEANQARKAEFMPIPGWSLAILVAVVIVAVLVAVLN